ncbi:acyltransferase [Heyndrickxia camelliae]|uniref:N-acetyltransferase n=1 Tax=Heyndrickxia camelliae TaxID=1707093 RepID=A0A2N3LNT3_9BACI|nr:acyltransferase [Heyndrickxia camelliae]PKR86276.1 N-acetyltransferase [Heyndrickxia camelliae]
MSSEYFCHPTAEVSSNSKVGKATKIWNNVQIRENAIIGSNCILSKDVYIDEGVHIGDHCKIQNGVSVYKGVTIHNKVFLGPHMVFTNDLFPRATNENWKITETVVKEGASIGANATIVCGNEIGMYAMVAAGSVVTKDVPDFGLVAGNPAKLIGYVCQCGTKLLNINGCLFTCPSCKKDITIEKNQEGTK